MYKCTQCGNETETRTCILVGDESLEQCKECESLECLEKIDSIDGGAEVLYILTFLAIFLLSGCGKYKLSVQDTSPTATPAADIQATSTPTPTPTPIPIPMEPEANSGEFYVRCDSHVLPFFGYQALQYTVVQRSNWKNMA